MKAWLSLCLTLIVGCAPQIHLSQRRFAREFRCPVKDTKYKRLGGSAFRVRGCGQSAQYLCLNRVYDQICTREFSQDMLARSESRQPVVAPAPPSPRNQVHRNQNGEGNVSIDAWIVAPSWMVELRATPTPNIQAAVMTLKARTTINECQVDLVVDGVRREMPEPARGKDRFRLYLEMPLALLQEIASSRRAVARVCATTWEVDEMAKGVMAEMLMRIREELAFSTPSAPSEPADAPVQAGTI